MPPEQPEPDGSQDLPLQSQGATVPRFLYWFAGAGVGIGGDVLLARALWAAGWEREFWWVVIASLSLAMLFGLMRARVTFCNLQRDYHKARKGKNDARVQDCESEIRRIRAERKLNRIRGGGR